MEHPEMSGKGVDIEQALASPEHVIQSRRDPEVRLYYRRTDETGHGDRFICVVVKVTRQDAFIITAYLTDRVKQGDRLWPSE
jgi:hypothetical protein